MILINVRFPIREDRLEEWNELAASYERSVNAEPGCVFFEIARSVSDPLTFIAIEGFRDSDAGAEHMKNDYVSNFMQTMPDIVSGQPQIIYVDADEVDGFGPMGEISPRG